jgi:restriction endonuclease S subunit
MKLNQEQQETIKEQLRKYILSGLIDRDQRTPILVGSRSGDLVMENGEFFDYLKEWIENISGKKTDWVAGVEGREAFLGLCFIKNATNTTNDPNYFRVKDFRFVIELKAVVGK